MQFSSNWPIDRSLSGATTPSQSGPGSDGNEGVLRIPQSSSIARTSLTDCIVSYPGHSWAGDVLPLSRDAVGLFYCPSRLSNVLILIYESRMLKKYLGKLALLKVRVLLFHKVHDKNSILLLKVRVCSLP